MPNAAPKPPVSMVRLFWKMGGWSLLIPVIPLLVLTLVGQLVHQTAERFEAEGLKAEAEVLSKYWTESTDSDGDRTVSYWLELDYTTALGEEISLTRSVSRGQYDAAREGGTVEIFYLKSQPRKTEMTEGAHRTGAWVLQIVSLVLGLIALGLLWLIGGWTVAAVRARRYGARELAEVTEIATTGVRVNGRPRYRLVWKDAAGKTGKSVLRKGEELEDYPPGTRIAIYQGLKRAWWVEDVGDPPDRKA